MTQTVHEVEAQRVLSESVIPAVPGEFYSYPSKFTKDRPLYVFMKCKANKSRTLADAGSLGHEANLLFLFGDPDQVQVCAIGAACDFGLLGNTLSSESFGETWIAPADVASEDFYDLRSQKNVAKLVEICHGTCFRHEVSIALKPGAVIAMMTEAGKYGMFVVNDLTSASIDIDACHILL